MMNLKDIKQYLEERLPDFKFLTNPNPGNENKLWIERDGQHIILEISKVENKKGAKKLKEFIETKWSQTEM